MDQELFDQLSSPDATTRLLAVSDLGDGLRHGRLPAETLADIGEALLELLVEEEDQAVASRAAGELVHALVTGRVELDTSVLQVVLEGPEPGPRSLARCLQVVAAAGGHGALARVEPFLAHPDPGVRASAEAAAAMLKSRLSP